MTWRTKTRHARAIRFIETYCVAPKGYGAGKPIRLAPFQKEWLEEVLAPGVHAAVESMPRGNGKSTFKAGLGCWAGFDPGESGDPQVPIIATTIKQGTKTIYGPLIKMVEANRELADRCKIFTALSDSKVVVPFTGGEIFPIADDPDGLQGLDPSLGIVDEIGFMSIESWASLLLATGKRPDSLIIAIGTPGFDEENALWHIRKGHFDGEREVHFTEFAGDTGCDLDDKEQWRKANPAYVAGFKGEHAFRVARSLPDPLFRIFQLGQWVAGTQSWLGADGRELWDATADPWRAVPAAKTWVAVDMARSRDSTAVVAAQRRPDGRLHCWVRIWRPQDSPAGVVDGQEVMGYLRQLDRDYDLVACGYDPRFFEERAGILKAERLPMEEFPQSIERMSPACGETFELIRQGLLTHPDDPEYRRHMLNAVLKLNSRGFTIQKATPNSPNRIDAAVATCMVVSLAAKERIRQPAVVL
jgi:phage terminase large subunit-like protein